MHSFWACGHLLSACGPQLFCSQLVALGFWPSVLLLAAYFNGLAEVRALPVDEGYDEGVFELCGDLFPQLQNLFVVSGFSVGVFVQPLVFVALRLQAFESGVLGFQRRIAGEYLNLEHGLSGFLLVFCSGCLFRVWVFHLVVHRLPFVDDGRQGLFDYGLRISLRSVFLRRWCFGLLFSSLSRLCRMVCAGVVFVAGISFSGGRFSSDASGGNRSPLLLLSAFCVRCFEAIARSGICGCGFSVASPMLSL